MRTTQVHADRREAQLAAQEAYRKAEAEARQLAEADAAVADAQARPAADFSDLDEFLDELDDLLDEVTESAEEFVRNYRQKGGE